MAANAEIGEVLRINLYESRAERDWTGRAEQKCTTDGKRDGLIVAVVCGLVSVLFVHPAPPDTGLLGWVRHYLIGLCLAGTWCDVVPQVRQLRRAPVDLDEGVLVETTNTPTVDSAG